MKFYQINNPTTKQIFDAIIANEYTPIESIEPKAKQLEVLLKDYWNCNEILVTFSNVTNTGGCPIFFASKDSIYDIASENNSNWYELSEEDQEAEIELLGSYTRTYKSLFNL